MPSSTLYTSEVTIFTDIRVPGKHDESRDNAECIFDALAEYLSTMARDWLRDHKDSLLTYNASAGTPVVSFVSEE